MLRFFHIFPPKDIQKRERRFFFNMDHFQKTYSKKEILIFFNKFIFLTPSTREIPYYYSKIFQTVSKKEIKKNPNFFSQDFK